MLLSACDDFLDKEPITEVSTNAYLYAENDLAAYAANFYTALPSHGQGTYSLGMLAADNGTDNQVANTPSAIMVNGETRVGSNNTWGNSFSTIRSVNHFMQTVLPRYEAGQLKGNAGKIKHYIGEMYFFRAWSYFIALQDLGDFPILDVKLTDDYDAVREASKRRPRNEVARFILSDLDKAYDMMLDNAPARGRLNKYCAALLKSRVALFEGTFEKYHQHTARVPKGEGWPGNQADYLAGYTYDANREIEFFLSQAVEAADIVASKFPLYADYAAMFNSTNLGAMNEVLLWREYSTDAANSVFHYVCSYLQSDGSGNTGYTRSMVDSYLMADGKPIYASPDYEGDDTYQHLFANRDPRMGLTILKPGDLLSEGSSFPEYTRSDGKSYYYRAPIFIANAEDANPTGYSIRKGLNTSASMARTKESTTAWPTFRAAEAYLNYIEAYYELNNSLGGNCQKYWSALRTRAGVSDDFQATINATDMQKEQLDWGSYSAGKQIDPTLYNIRRERRVELASEGLRFADLRRWRALDQVQNYHVQGFNFWESNFRLYTNPTPEDSKTTLKAYTPVEYGTAGANISAKSDPYAESKYLMPFRKNGANIGFNGLNWNQNRYLYPISNREFRLTTKQAGSNDYATSSIYQNPGWSMNDSDLPAGDTNP